ncbi:unnamed protein product [Laminaria digitata]
MSCERAQSLLPQAVMSRAWRAIALLLGTTTHDCIAFVPSSFGVNRHVVPETTASTAWKSGGISIASHVGRRPARRSSSYSCAALTMAKKPKMGKGKGKGKASRMELIER